jgi:hypothetical protein
MEQIVRFFCTAEKVVEEHAIDVNSPQRAPKRKGILETGVYKTD